MKETKSKKQVSYLLSKDTPLSGPQKAKLMSELHSGKVAVRSRPEKKPTRFSQAEFNKVHNKIYQK